MSNADERKRALRETLKRLRAERPDQVKAATAASSVLRGERKKIVTEMASAPMSVPQLAAATALPTDRVLWHIAAMRKYGQLVEAPERDGDYFTYALVPNAEVGDAAAGSDKGASHDSADAAQAEVNTATTQEAKAASEQTDEESGEG